MKAGDLVLLQSFYTRHSTWDGATVTYLGPYMLAPAGWPAHAVVRLANGKEMAVKMDDLSIMGACGHPVQAAHLPSMATGHDDPIVCAECFCPTSASVEAATAALKAHITHSDPTALEIGPAPGQDGNFEPAEAVHDLLADLLHFCDWNGLEVSLMLYQALDNHDAEGDGE